MSENAVIQVPTGFVRSKVQGQGSKLHSANQTLDFGRRTYLSVVLAVAFSVAPEGLSKRGYVLAVAKYLVVVTGRDLFLTIGLIERLIRTKLIEAWANRTQAFHPECIN
jgi:hypothetical protein